MAGRFLQQNEINIYNIYAINKNSGQFVKMYTHKHTKKDTKNNIYRRAVGKCILL